jgi:1-acyl-sn-glycerol-3-phosphate acyltransferase
MLLLLLQVLIAVPLTIICSVVSVASLPLYPSGRGYHGTGRFWSRFLLKLCRVGVVVRGAENIQRGKRYIYVSNHASLFDIPTIVGYIPDQLRLVFKKELTKVPFLGWALKFGPYIPIDRSKSIAGMRSLEKAAERIRSGASVVVFAEGTRSKDGTLQPFKRGAFTLAAKSGAPIIPVTIRGSSAIMPKHSMKIHPGTIEMMLDKPIETAGRNTKQGELALMEEVRSVMLKHFAEGGIVLN